MHESAVIVAPVVPLIALGGAVVMTLPYGLLMGMMRFSPPAPRSRPVWPSRPRRWPPVPGEQHDNDRCPSA